MTDSNVVKMEDITKEDMADNNLQNLRQEIKPELDKLFQALIDFRNAGMQGMAAQNELMRMITFALDPHKTMSRSNECYSELAEKNKKLEEQSRQYREWTTDKEQAFDEMQLIVYELEGMATFMYERQAQMENAEFYLAERMITLINQIAKMATQEKPLSKIEQGED